MFKANFSGDKSI